MVETMLNLVNEVLQSAVGNYFRNTLQGLPAVTFIQTRQEVQNQAEEYVTGYLGKYSVETKGVYIQDVVLPDALVEVLSSRELAVQQRETYAREEEAQGAQIEVERAKGTADSQVDLAHAQVNVAVQRSHAEARSAEAEGESSYVRLTGEAVADRTRAVGLAEATAIEAKGVAQATGYEAQTEALGSQATAIVAVANAVSEGHVKVVPDVLVTGGGGSLDGLAASLMNVLGRHDGEADRGLEGATVSVDADLGKKPTRAASARRPRKPIPPKSDEPAKSVPPPPPPEDP